MRRFVKRIEKRKAQLEEKLTAMAEGVGKDDGLAFEDLGVDWLIIDEAHAYKNLETRTRMEGVAGIKTEGSNRAFDLFIKTRYLMARRPGFGVTFLTGTPISNSMVEMYTMLRYLAPHLLDERDIAHFDAFAAAFGQVTDVMELSVDGAGMRPRTRFARFVNLPELLQLWSTVADVQTADMIKLPCPELHGGKPIVIGVPMTERSEEPHV